MLDLHRSSQTLVLRVVDWEMIQIRMDIRLHPWTRWKSSMFGSRQMTEETVDLWKSTRCVKMLGMSINLFFTLGSSAPNFWHQRMDTSSKRETWIQIPQEKMVLLMVQKSGDHQLRLVVYPLIHPRWPGGAGFLPSTVWTVDLLRSFALDIWPTWCPCQVFHLPNIEVPKNTNHTTLPPT